MSNRRVAAIITAAGQSSRMGRPKALLQWKGSALVAHQVNCLAAAGLGPIIVVTGCDAETISPAIPRGATVINNPTWRTGRSSSIEAGAQNIPDLHDILVVGVDQPIEPRVIDALMAAETADLIEPCDPSGHTGHPVIIGARQISALRRLSQRPYGLRSLVRELRPQGIKILCAELTHFDINTPADFLIASSSGSST